MSHARHQVDPRADTERLERESSPSRGSAVLGPDLIVRWRLGALLLSVGAIVGAALWCYRIERGQSSTVRLLNVLVEIEIARGGIPPDQLKHLVEEKSQ